ncbi:MAG: DUF7662 domain-containing protein [Gammaproteobacteria bacterium]
MELAMGKYEPLSNFLRKQTANEVKVSFEQIERIIGDKLPASAHEHRAWWSNNPNNSVMTKAWIEAGFRSEQVDMDGRKLVFRRVRGQGSSMTDSKPEGAHPLIGWMKGTVRVSPGVDLTKPADPEWGRRAWADRK